LLTLEALAWITFLVGLFSFWWHSDRIKSLAMQRVYQVCNEQQLQLLDQTMVLKGISLKRDDTGIVGIHRRYEFEFTTTGEKRHRGRVSLLGNTMLSLELEPYIIPESDHTLH
jgi:hypothetical protein